jgi:hypothetical protein
MLIVAMLFAPIKNKLQVWADRWFYGERYTLRTGLQDFGRTLSQTTALPQLLDSLVRRSRKDQTMNPLLEKLAQQLLDGSLPLEDFVAARAAQRASLPALSGTGFLASAEWYDLGGGAMLRALQGSPNRDRSQRLDGRQQIDQPLIG